MRGVSVPQVVKAQAVESSAMHEVAKARCEGVRLPRRPVRCRKHEVGVLVALAKRETVPCLLGAMALQRLDGERWQVDLAAALCGLGLLEGEASSRLFESLPNAERLPVHIHVLPAKAQEFPSSHACRDRNKRNRVEAARRERREQAPGTCLVQHPHFVPQRAGRFNSIRRVPHEKLPSDGLP